jgi:signal transduction histidine kinase
VVAITEDGGGMVTIRVIDSGPGVPAEIRDRLFTRFVTERDHVSDGTGLGLAITRGLVEAHGGSVVLEPSAQGATFRVTLPKADISSPLSASPKA